METIIAVALSTEKKPKAANIEYKILVAAFLVSYGTLLAIAFGLITI